MLLPAAPLSAQTAASAPWSASATTMVTSEAKTFDSGDATLSGTLYLPKGGQALAAVVVTHAASSPLQEAVLYTHLKQMLPAMGIAVFVYDRRGNGKSGGTPKNSGFQLLADDAVAAVKMLQADARIDPKRVGIWGLSQGGWLSLLAASRSSKVRFVVSISAPVVTPDVQMMFLTDNAMRVFGYAQPEIDQMREARKAVDDYMRGIGERVTAPRTTLT
jgi:dipeptidyl aminopeptidase/acylaminoacyl peptidase